MGISVGLITDCIVIYYNVDFFYYVFSFTFIPGVGISVVLITGCIVIYYNVVVAYCIFYFFASMAGTLPWSYCDQDWNTCYCRDSTMDMNSTIPWENGTRLYNECSKFNIFPRLQMLFYGFHMVLFLRWVVISAWDASFPQYSFLFSFLQSSVRSEFVVYEKFYCGSVFLQISQQEATKVITISENIIR